MIRPRLINFLFVIAAFLLSSLAVALPNDREQPIHISANSAEIDDSKGISIYRGKVNMTQGSIKLKAEQIIIHSDAQGISKLIATGAPAHFQQLPETDKQMMHAFGETIEYYIAEERIELKKQAKLEQEQNIFTGERIDYDIKQRLVNAYGSGSKTRTTSDDTRVNLVIQPTKTSDETANSSDNNE